MRAARSRAVLALALAAAGLGCGSSSSDAPPTASDGLVVILPHGEGGTDLASVRLADGRAAFLTDTPERAKGTPLWLPAVQRVLFTQSISSEEPGSVHMMLLDPRTGRVRGATERPIDLELQPSSSPDGKQVAYTWSGPTRRGHGEGIKLLRVMNATDRVFRMSRQRAILRTPDLSPVDTSVAAEVHRGGGRVDIWLLKEDGDDLRLVEMPQFADTSPRFSRAGGTIYFDRRYAGARRAGTDLGGGDVCGVHVETAAVQCLAASDDAREYGIDPSPARDEVAFLRETEEGTEILVLDPRGEGAPRVIAQAPGAARGLRWSPDGERLAFETGPLAEPRVTVVDRAGELLLETEGAAPAWAPPWIPEG